MARDSLISLANKVCKVAGGPYLSIYLSFHLAVHFSIYLPIYLLSIHLSFFLVVYLSIYLASFQLIFVSLCPPIVVSTPCRTRHF
jgi:hypothetical protein